MKFADVRGRYGTVRGVCNGCRYNRVMIQSISHERTRGDVMSAASPSLQLVRLAIFNRQSREGERRRERETIATIASSAERGIM